MKHKPVYLMLAILISTMGSFIAINVLSNFSGFITYLGFTSEGHGTPLSWCLALIVTVLYCYSASSISDVKKYMFKVDFLKFVAVVGAICAGVVEEILFRKWVMDYLASEGFSIIFQIFASGLTFGLAHLIWGLKNIKAGINAALSTFLLGIALGVVYLASDRSLAPCIVAHFLITALIEPGLLIAAQKDKLGYWKEKTNKSTQPSTNVSAD
ncbi:CPBP family intramembrane metalloprotease [Shewanella rhizosphaerae]|uniref:CPBP family intramembrane glutamic endopeptidase n=1 Tax=Shewanella rhizosphaerae TaxID=2864207 RepID=UPI001C656A60|nr:CPBP family intramembrane glutamic endopeptidase [Shewanella rhizosphaerae]QYK14028.1 CPBP family intramembrane metalloprotease [Shewanella rhizosphaerae]